MVYNTTVLQHAVRARFHEQYTAMLERPHLQRVENLLTRAPSDGHSEKYAWLGDVPQVSEWIGDKTIGSLKDYDYEIKNKDYYAGFSVDRNEIDDERISAIMPRVDSLAQAVAQWPWELVVELIEDGGTNLAYDGNAFFSDRGGNNDNIVSGTGTSVSELRTDVATARTTMMKFESDTGRRLGIVGNVIVVPPDLEASMLEAVRAQTTIAVDGQGQAFNPAATWIDNVIVLPELTDASDWYMFSTNMALRPFILQMRSDVLPVMDDTQVKRNRKIDFSAEIRGNAGYGLWQMAVKVDN